MATQKKIIEMIGAIKTIYSYYAKETDVKLLVATWDRLLQGYDDATIEQAFYKCLQTCKMPPTPADVIEQINTLSRALEPSDNELWAVYIKALRETNVQLSRFGYTFIDSTGISQGQQARQKVEQIWASLPEKIKSYLGAKGELIRNAQAWGANTDYGDYEKPRFLKAMPIMEKRQEYKGLMLEGGSDKLLIGGD